MKRKLIAALMCFTMLMSTSFPYTGAFAVSSRDKGTDTENTAGPAVNYTNVAPFLPPVEGTSSKKLKEVYLLSAARDGNDTSSGLVMNKTVSDPDENGVYTLTLEAYATGEKITETISKDVPTDIIMVLDQSGSMNENFTNSSRIYNAVYELDKKETYYIKSGYGSDNYDRVTWCSNCDAWTFGCGWFFSHIKGTVCIPKTSAEDTTNGRVQFYEQVSTSAVTKLNALKAAVNGFANEVYAKAKGTDGMLGTDDDVNHRIAVVGFASGKKYGNTNYNYGNTELFVGSAQYTYNAGSYNSASNTNSAQSHYGAAFQNMNTQAGYNNVIASKNALDADGGTIINLGLEMANGILANNTIPSGEKRNRVVIVFTDGVPGWDGYDSNVASSAITEAETLKNTYGATVYSIGVFSGADATSAGNQNGDQTQKANWFMQNLSSNNGKVQTPSYYLSASDADALNNIFQQISDEISSGGSSITLDENSVVKDVVSEYFTLPDGTVKDNIKVYTQDYTAENIFSAKQIFKDAQVNISGKTISVTNFSFKDNWVGTETYNGSTKYRGKKLVIEIPVVVREGFLGGNGVPTNGAGSGIYENPASTEAFKEFTSPTTDIETKSITIAAPEKNIYLYGSLTQAQLMDNVVIKSGDVVIDASAASYDLEAWQYAYVNITATKPDACNQLTADSTYNVSCTITPKNSGKAQAKTGNATGNINVFMPKLTFKDSQVYYGDCVPTDLQYNSNSLTSTVWKHGDMLSTDQDVSMIGNAPELNLTYTTDAGVKDGKVITTEDIPVKVAVAIDGNNVTDKTTFEHDTCTIETQCGFNKDTEQFLLHVKTCTLVVKKSGSEDVDENASFIFNVKGDNEVVPVNLDVVVHGNGSVTIVGLPVGTYTATEDNNWSWRYTAVSDNSITFTTTNNDSVDYATINIENQRKKDKWLDGYYWIKNIFDNESTVQKPEANN